MIHASIHDLEQTYDVVVIGGGPHGVTYANWVKKWRPGARIAIVDRKPTTGYKVGESLLSTSTRSLVAQGLSMPILRRLFGNKAGIRFWWTGPDSATLDRPIDVVDIEETFQVERRVLDLALQETARRNGITLLTGTRIDPKASDFDGPVKTLHANGPGGPVALRARWVCDASGPATVLARHFGHYRKAPERHQSFTTHSFFSYFRPRKDVPLPLWDEPATRHLCFPGGWIWFITLNSWTPTPDDTLRPLVNHLLDHADAPDERLPSRDALCRHFGAETEKMVSIGVTVRADRDRTGRLPVEQRFRHYIDRHPGAAWLMDHFEPIEPEGHDAPYMSFCNLVHDSERYAGDGWCLVGDAASFVNPIFSPGLNLGSGSCYLAAKATVEALDADAPDDAFASYEAYMRDVYEAVLAETDLYHRAFDHVDAYEWALMLKLFFGAVDVVDRGETYSETDPYVHDLLNPEFRACVEEARAHLWAAEACGLPVAAAAARVRATAEPFIRRILAEPYVRSLKIGSVFNYYTDSGRRVALKKSRRPAFGFRRCNRCRQHVDRRLERCPVCGDPSADRTVRRRAGNG